MTTWKYAPPPQHIRRPARPPANPELHEIGATATNQQTGQVWVVVWDHDTGYQDWQLEGEA